jgi:hypothetical protein
MLGRPKQSKIEILAPKEEELLIKEINTCA